MEPVASVEAHVVSFAVKDDVCTTIVGIAEELVEQPPPEATAGGYRRQVVDAPPGGGSLRQLGHQHLLVLVRVERTPTGHEPAESDDGEPDSGDDLAVGSDRHQKGAQREQEDGAADDHQDASNCRGGQYSAQLAGYVPVPLDAGCDGPQQHGSVGRIRHYPTGRPSIGELDGNAVEQLDGSEQLA